MAEPTIYTTGGTVQAGRGIYLSRQADADLFSLCQEGAFVYILTPRQMGKSSLMVQTANRLSDEGTRSVIIDLTQLGVQVTAEQWYLGLLTIIEEQLDLDANVMQWWQERSHLGITQRMIQFFREVLLVEVERVIIFVDEIDSTLSLDFTDDFFAAIRYFYVARTQESVFQHLSFVLIGVATPGGLIRDPKRTPFNIGQREDLTDFTLEEAMPLSKGLGLPFDQSEQVLRLVLQWTGGHPYLTQRLCQALVDEKKPTWSKAEVEWVVKHTFFGQESKNDTNLLFVRDMLTRRSPNQSEILIVYRDILRDKQKILDEEQSVFKSHLKLSGIVVSENGYLKVRNPIYKEVFNKRWVNENLPINWIKKTRSAAIFTGIIFLVLLVPISIFADVQRRYAIKQEKIAIQQRQIAEKERKIAEEQTREAQKQKALVENLVLGGTSRVAKQNLSTEVKAFLDTLAWSLGRLPKNGYKQKINGEEFVGFADHPRKIICGEFYGYGKKRVCADSAGRYHILSQTWDSLAQRLGLSSFSPESQDLAAVELLRESKALKDLESGNLDAAIYKASYDWVILPDEKGHSRSGFKAYSIEELKFMYSIFYARYKS
jgi:muramidase (phage lysozyme)